jgi:hypothetical protein
MKLFRNFVTAAALVLTGLFGMLAYAQAQSSDQLLYTPTGKELIQLTPPGSATNAYVPLAAVRDGAQYVYTVPLTGFTITMTTEQSVLSLNPAGTLATGLITLPATLYDGKIVTVFSTQVVTTLSWATSNSATFVPSAPTTIAANGSLSFIYDKTNNQWHRFQ